MSMANNWPVVPLREVADIAAGITLGRKTRETKLISVPYLRVANVQDGRLDLSEIKTVEATESEIEKCRLEDGDLLLTEGGDLDKLGRGTVWRNELPLCIHQNHIFRVRFPKDRYNPDFMSFQVGSSYGKSYFLAHAKKTTGIASINQKVLGSFPVLSPQIDDQIHISNKLIELFVLSEHAKRNVIETLKDIKKLLSSLYVNELTKCTKTFAVKLGEVAWIDAPIVDPTKPQFCSLPHVSAENIEPITGRIGNIRSAFEDGMGSGKYLFKSGDVLYSKLRPYLRKASVVDFAGLCSADMYPIKTDISRLLPEYLRIVLVSDGFTEYANEASARSRMPKLNREQLFSYEMELPDIANQTELVNSLYPKVSAAEILRRISETRLQEINILSSRILDAAF